MRKIFLKRIFSLFKKVSQDDQCVEKTAREKLEVTLGALTSYRQNFGSREAKQTIKELLQSPAHSRLLDGVRLDSSNFYFLMIWNDATLSITLFDIGLNLFVITDIGYQKHSLMACVLN